MFKQIIICWGFLVSMILNCHAARVAEYSRYNGDEQSNPLKANQASYHGGANPWMPWQENPLYQRYHSPGSDFAGRGSPVRFTDDDVAKALGMEVNQPYFLSEN